jgi:hypothetical protein
MLVAHVTLELGLGDQRCHRVDDHQVHRLGAHQHVRDLERLLAVVRLGKKQLLGLDPELLGVGDVERMLGVDEGAHATFVQGQGGLARRLRTVHFHDPAARQSSHAQREVESERTGADDGNFPLHAGVPELHQRAFAVLLFDRCHHAGQPLGPVLFSHDEFLSG